MEIFVLLFLFLLSIVIYSVSRANGRTQLVNDGKAAYFVKVAASGKGVVYHRLSCSKCRAGIEMTTDQARSRGYAPCATCGGRGQFRLLPSEAVLLPKTGSSVVQHTKTADLVLEGPAIIIPEKSSVSLVSAYSQPAKATDLPTSTMPAVKPYALPTEALLKLSETAGLQWVNSNRPLVVEARESILEEPKPLQGLPRPPMSQAMNQEMLDLIKTNTKWKSLKK